MVDHGVPDLVTAVEQRDVTVSAAADFAKVNPPIEQARLIAEHDGSVAAAVSASRPDVKAKADRAAHKTPKPKPDVTPAANRAEQAATAKLAASALIDVIEDWGRANVSAAAIALSQVRCAHCRHPRHVA